MMKWWNDSNIEQNGVMYNNENSNDVMKNNDDNENEE